MKALKSIFNFAISAAGVLGMTALGTVVGIWAYNKFSGKKFTLPFLNGNSVKLPKNRNPL